MQDKYDLKGIHFIVSRKYIKDFKPEQISKYALQKDATELDDENCYEGEDIPFKLTIYSPHATLKEFKA